jgi:hypothetical protein
MPESIGLHAGQTVALACDECKTTTLFDPKEPNADPLAEAHGHVQATGHVCEIRNTVITRFSPIPGT